MLTDRFITLLTARINDTTLRFAHSYDNQYRHGDLWLLLFLRYSFSFELGVFFSFISILNFNLSISSVLCIVQLRMCLSHSETLISYVYIRILYKNFESIRMKAFVFNVLSHNLFFSNRVVLIKNVITRLCFRIGYVVYLLKRSYYYYNSINTFPSIIVLSHHGNKFKIKYYFKSTHNVYGVEE